MQWLYPGGAWALLALIPVILLWMLKKKAKREKVPSLLLWKRMESDAPQHKPFQRLRSRLLLWMQIALVLVLTAALMRPVTHGGSAGESVFVFDLSLSMQTQNADGSTRLDEAREQALALLDGMAEGDQVTVLTAGGKFQQELSRCSDHLQVRRTIESLSAENGGSDLEGALALARAMSRDLEQLRIFVFTDDPSADAEGITLCAVGESIENRALLEASMQPESGTAFARVKNFGSACDLTLECRADGSLCDVRTISMAADGQTSVRFAIPQNAQTVQISIADADALNVDNTRWAVRPQTSQRTALLVTEENVFLQQALALNKSLTVTLASPTDVETALGYDLYLYDSVLPETLPESGAIFALNPSGPVGQITPGEQEQLSGSLRAASGETAEAICENLLLSEIALRSACPLEGGTPVLTADGKTLLAVDETADRRLAVLAFDVHDSNLPLKADFPVMIQNLLAWLLPEASTGLQNAVCGEKVTITPDVRVESTAVETPSGKVVNLNGGQLLDTNEMGVYTLREHYDDGEERETSFTLHPPATESDTLHVAESTAHAENPTRTGGYRERTLLLLLLAFVLLLLEWEVSRRGV